MKRLPLLIVLAVAATLFAAPVASSQVEVYAPNDFVFGQATTVSLRGTLDAPTGGQTIKVRQIEASLTCPTATGTTVPVRFTFTAWIPGGGPVNVQNASSGVYSGDRDSRFCIYAYYENGGMGEANPNTSYSHVVHFRDPIPPPPPVVNIDWMHVSSSVSPELPYFIFTGTNETYGGESIAFVPQASACPGSFPGGTGAVSFPGATSASFSRFGEAGVGIGFWRACGYATANGVSTLSRDAVFSRAPVGGWKPSYKLLKGKAPVKSGKIALGKATCPGPCSITVKAVLGKKTVATGKASGSGGALKLKLKANSAGKKAAKRRKKAKFSITSVIDQSTITKTVTLKLR